MDTTPKTPLAIPTEPDERITAWEAIAAHPAFRPGFAGDGPVLPRMLAKLDEWAPLTQTAPTVDPDDLRPGDRFRAIYEYRVDHLGDWLPVAESRYELLSHDDDPRVAVVREWWRQFSADEALDDDLRSGTAADLLARLDAVRADA